MKQAMGRGADDLFRYLAGRAVPGAGQLLDAGRLRELLDEVRKGMSGVEEIERRVSVIEERLAAIESRLESLPRTRAPSTRGGSAAKKRPSQSDTP